jgi:transcriptional regulator with XRE-family HTH domain
MATRTTAKTTSRPGGGVATAEVEAVLIEGWTFDVTTPWDDRDTAWLEVCLRLAEHFDDAGDPAHDPVQCQERIPAGEPHAEWKLLRDEAGLTLRQLGRLIGADQATISRWENGLRWPDNRAYHDWLRTAGERLGEEARLRAFIAQSKRDGWLGPERVVGQDLPTRLAHWDVFYKPGGLFDRWIETGSLPAWTPRDAGIDRIGPT